MSVFAGVCSAVLLKPSRNTSDKSRAKVSGRSRGKDYSALLCVRVRVFTCACMCVCVRVFVCLCVRVLIVCGIAVLRGSSRGGGAIYAYVCVL